MEPVSNTKSGTKSKQVKTNSELVRPVHPRVPCFAILDDETSELKIVNLEGGSSNSVKISDHWPVGIVSNNVEVYAVTQMEILKLHSDGSTTILQQLKDKLDEFSQIVLFQKKIYIIQPCGKSMLCFDPADNSLTDDLPGCRLGYGICASATDDFIYAMGMKYDPLTSTWAETAPMRKERTWGAAATLDRGIYAIGGQEEGASAEYYDPCNNSRTDISKMNVRREHFGACPVGGKLYAVGGDMPRKKKNGFYKHSIEVYDKNKWTVATKFQTKDFLIYSCFWPHGSHQPGPTKPKDLPEAVDTTYRQSRIENLMDAKKKIGFKKENIEYAGSKINLSEGALKEEKEVTYSAQVGVDQKEGMPDITPTYECDPPLTFEKPVSMTMRTCISAPAGKTIPASLLTRDHPGDEWKETQQVIVGPRNEVDFEIDRCGGIRLAVKSFDVKLHLINGFHINLETGTTAVTFSKDQAVYTAVQESMRQHGFVNFALIPHDVQAKFGSEISVSMEQKEPKDCTISKPYPSPTFILDEDYLQRGKHVVYFHLDPQPSDQCKTISMEYGYKINGDPEQILSLRKKWPQKDSIRGASDAGLMLGDGCAVTLIDCNFNVHGGDKETCSHGNVTNITYNITGDASTIVNAPVGQLATGNANITNQGAGNNFVAGSQENTDRSVTAGKAFYGQSTSSSTGENITVHRTGK